MDAAWFDIKEALNILDRSLNYPSHKFLIRSIRQNLTLVEGLMKKSVRKSFKSLEPKKKSMINKLLKK